MAAEGSTRGRLPILRASCNSTTASIFSIQRRRIDVALIRASLADERGNISFEREAFSLGALHAALAARNSGGQVFVEVDDVVAAGSLDPQKVVIPGHVVSAVVRAEMSSMPSELAGGRPPRGLANGGSRASVERRRRVRRMK